jgi:hypothetical protein
MYIKQEMFRQAVEKQNRETITFMVENGFISRTELGQAIAEAARREEKEFLNFLVYLDTKNSEMLLKVEYTGIQAKRLQAMGPFGLGQGVGYNNPFNPAPVNTTYNPTNQNFRSFNSFNPQAPQAVQPQKDVTIEESEQFDKFIDSIDEALDPLYKNNADPDGCPADEYVKTSAKIDAYNDCKNAAKQFLKGIATERCC